MGNEISSIERETRYREFHNALHIIDKDIMKDLMNSDISKKKYMLFGLVNKGLLKKYKFLSKEEFDGNEARNKIFDYKDLAEIIEDKKFKHINPRFSFGFPSNFMFVNKDFLDVIQDFIDKNYRHYIQNVYNTIIGGYCLILGNAKDIKDESPFRYIVLYQDINDNQGNEIDFFLYIKDKKERKAADKFILEYDLWTYFKKIKYNYKDEYRKIYNEHNQEIGYVVRCTDIFRIETYICKIESLRKPISNNAPNMKVNVNNNNGNSNNFNNYTGNNIKGNFNNNVSNPNNMNPKFNFNSNNMNADQSRKNGLNPCTIARKTYAKINPDISIDSVISFFFQIDELKKILFPNKNIDIKNFQNFILTKVDPKIKTFQTYDKIFEEILTKLDPDNQINKDYYSQPEQYNEEKGLKKFMEKLNNKNIIQKLFLIPKEEKISCKNCGMDTFKFYFGKYIIIENPLNELLSKKIFTAENENKRDKFCNFCNGQTTDCAIERKTLDFPEILIVIISPSQVNNFNISENLIFTNGMISYSLNKFIESNNNCLYWIDDINTMICHKYEITRLGAPEKISDKKPIVLFYNKFNNSLNNLNINDNNQNNIVKTIDVLNNNIQIQNPQNLLNPKTCVFKNGQIMNNQQNVGQQNINPQLMNQQFNQKLLNPQIMNNQNNIINFDNNQSFMNQQNCFQNNINNNNIFGINMNQFNNMNNNNNMQMNNMNMNNVNNINNINNGFMMNNNDGNMNMQFQNNMMNNNMMNNMNNMNMMNNNKINMQNNFQNNNLNLVSFDEIIVIQFISGDSTVNKGIKCLPSQKFYEVEEKLYNFYPEHRKNNNNFITNGRPVIRFHTIAENNIKDGQVVQIIPVD